MRAVIDNDVLLKGSCYGLLDVLVSTFCSVSDRVGVLASAKFVVSKRIGSARLLGNHASARAAFLGFLSRASALEPTTGEQKMAANLEFAAQKLAISLDSGESQLCAILVHRALPSLLTGDKRAIAAIERLLDAESKLIPICGKVKCLEQLFAAALARDGSTDLRRAVCAEPEIDKALTICFSCGSPSMAPASFQDGLNSYINALRHLAGRVLAP
jgi:hypothetical protein